MKTIKDFTADSITIADCTGYHTARLNSAWTDATQEGQQAAIIRAWDYIRVQPFRTDIDIFTDGLPEDIKQAGYEAALIEIQAPGELMKTETKESNVIQKRIDVISTTYLAGAKTVYHKLNSLLAPYLEAPGIKLTR